MTFPTFPTVYCTDMSDSPPPTGINKALVYLSTLIRFHNSCDILWVRRLQPERLRKSIIDPMLINILRLGSLDLDHISGHISGRYESEGFETFKPCKERRMQHGSESRRPSGDDFLRDRNQRPFCYSQVSC